MPDYEHVAEWETLLSLDVAAQHLTTYGDKVLSR